jgi:hypothetical protein
MQINLPRAIIRFYHFLAQARFEDGQTGIIFIYSR